MTTEPDLSPSAPRPCSGTITGAWVPKAGEPQNDSCVLCPDSGRHWRDSPEVRQRQAAADQG